jgi:hypothetical protein
MGTQGGAWTNVQDGAPIRYSVHDGEYAEISFFGPVEMTLSMSKGTLLRCRDILSDALCELD